MSGRFVRASKFRHVYGDAPKPEGCFLEVKAEAGTSWSGNMMACNAKYVACAKKSGGGPVYIFNVDKPGRTAPTYPSLAVHKRTVVDMDFNPFNPNMIATASEDNYAKVSIIPADFGAESKDIDAAASTLEGHQKPLNHVLFHPTAANVLATTSKDGCVKLFDVEAQAEMLNVDMGTSGFHHITFNNNGSQIAVVGKDKTVSFFDPRSGNAGCNTITLKSPKHAAVFYAEALGYIITVGAGPAGQSKQTAVAVFDVNNLDKAIGTLPLSASRSFAHFDQDTSMLFVGGKGDLGVKYIEVTKEAPYLHFCSEFKGRKATSGLCFAPKKAVNVLQHEIVRAYRLCLSGNYVEPIGFKVPRKNEMFQADIFPDTIDVVSKMTAEEYAGGKNVDVSTCSMDPKQRGDAEVVVKAFVAQKSPAQLKAEIAEKDAIIADLRKQLAAK